MPPTILITRHGCGEIIGPGTDLYRLHVGGADDLQVPQDKPLGVGQGIPLGAFVGGLFDVRLTVRVGDLEAGFGRATADVLDLRLAILCPGSEGPEEEGTE